MTRRAVSGSLPAAQRQEFNLTGPPRVAKRGFRRRIESKYHVASEGDVGVAGADRSEETDVAGIPAALLFCPRFFAQ